MNKYQEAYNTIDEIMAYYQGRKSNIVAMRLFKELVDKETPLNLPLHHGVYMQCKCEAMNEVHNNYCWNCGQKLNWSKEEEDNK